MGDKRASLVFTDPPYNVKIDGHVSGNGRIAHREFAMAGGEMTTNAYRDFLRSALNNAHDHSSDGSLHYICIDWRHIDDVLVIGKSTDADLINVCCWVKPNAGMGSFYRSQAGSVARIAAQSIEGIVISTIRERLTFDAQTPGDQFRCHVVDSVADVIVQPMKITIRLQSDNSEVIEIPWQAPVKNSPALPSPTSDTDQPDPKLLQAMVRAHAWLRDLQSGKFDSVEALAASVKLHPKVIRQELRYASRAPSITEAILTGDQPSTLSLARLRKTLPLTWSGQCRAQGN